MIKRISTEQLNNRILFNRMIIKGINRDEIEARVDQGLTIPQIYKNARARMVFDGV